MRKSDKKIDNQIRKDLTQVCDSALESIAGFKWLTHQIDYAHFPQSLVITCVFDTNQSLSTFLGSESKAAIEDAIASKMLALGVTRKQLNRCISYDSEEACNAQDEGNWARRLGKGKRSVH